MLLQLTVPAEDNIVQRHSDKEFKYARLVDDIELNHWKGHIFAVEIGSRGYVAKSFGYAMRKLGAVQCQVKKFTLELNQICLRSSYTIYLCRRNNVWRSWENKYFPEKVRRKKQNSSAAEEQVNNFTGFSSEEISCAHGINCGRLDVINSIIKRKSKDSSNTISDSGGFSGNILASRFLNNMSHLLEGKHRDIKKKSDCSSKRAENVKAGLVNLGNTCYMNSIIQCLSNITPLTDYFLKGNIEGEINENGGTAKQLGVVFKALHGGQTCPINMKNFKMTIDCIHKQFSGYGQHDSHEFLIMLMEWLHEDLQIKTSCDLPDCVVGENLMEQKSIISSLFFGQHRVVIMCSICHNKSVNFEPFSVITLSFPVGGGGSLNELLHHYYRENIIDYRCPKCKRMCNGTQRIEIWHLPPVLILHLNRFEYTVTMRKKQNHVDFPLEHLDLATHTARKDSNKKFELCGVSNHYGTMDGGHYTSHCRSNKKWYEFNDDKVSIVAESDVSSSAAYILFYKMSNSVQMESGRPYPDG